MCVCVCVCLLYNIVRIFFFDGVIIRVKNLLLRYQIDLMSACEGVTSFVNVTNPK